MFRLAPAPRSGESLYSVLARLGRYLNAGQAGAFMDGVAGRRWAIASGDLPGGLSALVRDLPLELRKPAIDRVIDHLTALPFYTAFLPQEVRDAARLTMRGDVTGLYLRLGLAAFRVRPSDRLRFCPHCLDAMEAEHGDVWWRRDHQLPGITVCHIHGTLLRLSEVETGDRNRHTFVAASREVCRMDAEFSITVGVNGGLHDMAVLAKSAAALLVAPRPAKSFIEVRDGYRSRLSEVGLMRSAQKVDRAALIAAFQERWGRVTGLIPGLEFNDEPERCWLTALVRNSRRAAHPLQHLMLERMLVEMAEVPAAQPFGAGPWLCRNPVANHHGDKVIGAVTVRQDRETVFGDFACYCGYLYTVSRAPDGTMGAPRYRRFGPMLTPALKAAVARGDGLRAVARALGLDPKTVMREAAIAGVQVPWTLKASGSIPNVRAITCPVVASARGPRRHPRPRRNWFAIDVRLARAAKAAICAIASEAPPVRLTFAEIERRITRNDWVTKRRAKLPQTVSTIQAAMENVETFRHRRLVWSVRQAVVAGDMRACEVLRFAGLPMSWLPAVRSALLAAQLGVRAVA